MEPVRELLLLSGNIAEVVGEHLGRQLNADLEGVSVVYTVNDDLIIRPVTVIEKHGLDLAREYVDAANDKHIVSAASRLRHLDVSSAAGAFLPREAADVASPVSYDRKGLFIYSGENELAPRAVGQQTICFYNN